MEVQVNGSSMDGPGYRIEEPTELNSTFWNETGDSHEDDFVDKTLAEKLVIGLLLGIIIVCSVVGNSLVCIAVLTQRSLRRSSNFFYVSLACSDLLVSLAVMTFAGANDIRGSWLFGPTFCNIWLSLDVMCCTASILNICAISLDRYLHIRKPYTYHYLMSPRRTILVIVFVWALSILISFLPIHLEWHKQDNHDPWDGPRYICLLELNRIYAVCSSIISFYIPCLIMISMYISMYRLARHHLKSIKATTASYPNGAADHAYKPSDHKASITLGVIMGVFLFCWMPFFTVNVITAFIPLNPIAFVVTTWLGYINSMANPIIYTIFNKEFRLAFKKLLFIEKCCGRKCLCCSKHKKNYKRTANGTTSQNTTYGAVKQPVTSSPTSIPLLNLQNNNVAHV